MDAVTVATLKYSIQSLIEDMTELETQDSLRPHEVADLMDHGENLRNLISALKYFTTEDELQEFLDTV